jgi:hypothetical protein
MGGLAMTSPWLQVPLVDYEGHMALPGIQQAQMLSDILAGALERVRPGSVAVLGCAGGNGFERIPASVRVVGVDLNPRFCAAALARFGQRFESLEVIAGDIQTGDVCFAPVDLLFLGLVLEYVDVDVVIGNSLSMLRPGGTLLTVLQLPSGKHGKLSPSPYSSLQEVASFMRLVPPEDLLRIAQARGYRQLESRTVISVSAKPFQVQMFTLMQSTPPTPHAKRGGA